MTIKMSDSYEDIIMISYLRNEKDRRRIGQLKKNRIKTFITESISGRQRKKESWTQRK